jgi:hypothetical protein
MPECAPRRLLIPVLRERIVIARLELLAEQDGVPECVSEPFSCVMPVNAAGHNRYF